MGYYLERIGDTHRGEAAVEDWDKRLRRETDCAAGQLQDKGGKRQPCKETGAEESGVNPFSQNTGKRLYHKRAGQREKTAHGELP